MRPDGAPRSNDSAPHKGSKGCERPLRVQGEGRLSLAQPDPHLPIWKDMAKPGALPRPLAVAAQYRHDGAPMKRYRGFLFDVDNTLLDYDRAEAEALDETMADAAPSVPIEKARSVTGSSMRATGSASSRRKSPKELKVGRFADLLAALGAAGDAKAIGESYLLRLSRKAYFLPHAGGDRVPLPDRGALPCHKRLLGRPAGQDGGGGHRGLLLRHPHLGGDGVRQPDPRFFQAACAALDIPPADLLCVGDSPVTDVGGALSAGSTPAGTRRTAGVAGRRQSSDIGDRRPPGPDRDLGRLGE